MLDFQSSFAEIARLLSEFFRDLDVVPSDVLAGLILLRQRQQAARQQIISQVSLGGGGAVNMAQRTAEMQICTRVTGG